MTEIRKYGVHLPRLQLDLPDGAIVRHVDLQNGLPCLWIEMDPAQPSHTREFVLIGTGQPINATMRYVRTFQQPPYVWHVFEDMRTSEQSAQLSGE